MFFRYLRLLFTPGWLLLCLTVGAVQAADSIDFNKQIRPIFIQHCTACHGGVKEAGEVSFVTPDAVLPPDGWLVEPGDPDASVLIQRVESDDLDERMPPPEHGTALSKPEIKLLRGWIEQGAKWRGHWAYEKPVASDVPKPSDQQWSLQLLDNFVLARLDAEGLAPNEDATPVRWLRRVSLDLTGLPPTSKQRAEFLSDLSDRGEQAYAAVVDRLLLSSAYGERWASVWLDQIRYADSKGLGLDGRRNIWKYRDWVIKSLNQDMPYSDFTIKQIAGDLLPDATIGDLVATAAHRLTQTNQEGGTDDEEFRIAAVLDRVNTTWQTWQGVTFGCVQCHSHPYDPFKHEEYYRFAAFFNNTRDCDLDNDWPLVLAPLDSTDEEKAVELDREITQLKTRIWQQEFDLLTDKSRWQPIKHMTASTNNDTQVQIEPKSSHAEFHTVDTVSRDTTIVLEAELPNPDRPLTAIRFTGLPLDPLKAKVDSEWGFVLSRVTAKWVASDATTQPIEISKIIIDEPDPFYDPQESLNPKSNSGFAAFTRIHYPRTAAFILREPAKVPVGAKLRLELSNKVQALGAFPLVARRGYLAVSHDEQFTQLVTQPSINDQREQLAELERQRKAIASTPIPVMQERSKRFARPTNVFVRGLFLNKGDQVTPGTPASLPPIPDGVEIDRLALARWLVNEDNPLTARVAANRIWSRLFGVGIVATEEDFGSSGNVLRIRNCWTSWHYGFELSTTTALSPHSRTCIVADVSAKLGRSPRTRKTRFTEPAALARPTPSIACRDSARPSFSYIGFAKPKGWRTARTPSDSWRRMASIRGGQLDYT